MGAVGPDAQVADGVRQVGTAATGMETTSTRMLVGVWGVEISVLRACELCILVRGK